MSAMKRFFARNIDGRGRLARAIYGVLLIAAGIFVARHGIWYCVALGVAGGFSLFEAVRGWCVMRACGIKTKL